MPAMPSNSIRTSACMRNPSTGGKHYKADFTVLTSVKMLFLIFLWMPSLFAVIRGVGRAGRHCDSTAPDDCLHPSDLRSGTRLAYCILIVGAAHGGGGAPHYRQTNLVNSMPGMQ